MPNEPVGLKCRATGSHASITAGCDAEDVRVVDELVVLSMDVDKKVTSISDPLFFDGNSPEFERMIVRRGANPVGLRIRINGDYYMLDLSRLQG